MRATDVVAILPAIRAAIDRMPKALRPATTEVLDHYERTVRPRIDAATAMREARSAKTRGAITEAIRQIRRERPGLSERETTTKVRKRAHRILVDSTPPGTPAPRKPCAKTIHIVMLEFENESRLLGPKVHVP